MSAPRHWHFAAVPLAVGLAIGLDGVEIAARIFGLAPALPEQYSAFAPDAVLPWKPAPYRIEEGKPAINRENDRAYAEPAASRCIHQDRSHRAPWLDRRRRGER